MKPEISYDTKRNLLILSLGLLKFLIYGFSYFPILDDFIQYDGYLMQKSLSYVYFDIGTISTRPLASLLDPLFWGAMPLSLSLFLITMLHCASCILFYKSAQKAGFSLGPLFAIIYLLLPLGYESTYWLSASTRVVPGMFFASAGIYFLLTYIFDKKAYALILFWLCTLLCGGFYEAALAFSLTFCVITMLYFWKKIKCKWIFAIPFANAAAVCGIYAALSGVGNMGSRADGFLISEIFLAEKFSSFFSQLAEVLKGAFGPLLSLSFKNGLNALFCGKLSCFAIAVLMLFLSLMFLFLKKKSKKEKTERKRWHLVLLAIILFFAPLLVNFLSQEMWLTLRSFGFSIFSVALIIDTIFEKIKPERLTQISAFLLSLFFLVCGAGEYDSYKKVSEADILFCEKIAQKLDDEVLNGEKEAAVIIEKMPEGPEIFHYKDHIKSVTDSDWALTGAVRSVCKNIKIKRIFPVKSPDEIEGDFVQIIYID